MTPLSLLPFCLFSLPLSFLPFCLFASALFSWRERERERNFPLDFTCPRQTNDSSPFSIIFMRVQSHFVKHSTQPLLFHLSHTLVPPVGPSPSFSSSLSFSFIHPSKDRTRSLITRRQTHWQQNRLFFFTSLGLSFHFSLSLLMSF